MSIDICIRINDIARWVIRVPFNKEGIELCKQFLDLMVQELREVKDVEQTWSS